MSAADILATVAQSHGVRVSEIKGQTRLRHVAWARQEAMSRLHERGLSLGQIGRMLGHRHHTTVLHGVRRHQERIEAGQ